MADWKKIMLNGEPTQDWGYDAFNNARLDVDEKGTTQLRCASNDDSTDGGNLILQADGRDDTKGAVILRGHDISFCKPNPGQDIYNETPVLNISLDSTGGSGAGWNRIQNNGQGRGICITSIGGSPGNRNNTRLESVSGGIDLRPYTDMDVLLENYDGTEHTSTADASLVTKKQIESIAYTSTVDSFKFRLQANIGTMNHSKTYFMDVDDQVRSNLYDMSDSEEFTGVGDQIAIGGWLLTTLLPMPYDCIIKKMRLVCWQAAYYPGSTGPGDDAGTFKVWGVHANNPNYSAIANYVDAFSVANVDSLENGRTYHNIGFRNDTGSPLINYAVDEDDLVGIAISIPSGNNVQMMPSGHVVMMVERREN